MSASLASKIVRSSSSSSSRTLASLRCSFPSLLATVHQQDLLRRPQRVPAGHGRSPTPPWYQDLLRLRALPSPREHVRDRLLPSRFRPGLAEHRRASANLLCEELLRRCCTSRTARSSLFPELPHSSAGSFLVSTRELPVSNPIPCKTILFIIPFVPLFQ
jgi:hypothetical protein